MVHTLKGSARSVGASRVAALAEHAQTITRNSASAEALLTDIGTALAEVRAAVDRLALDAGCATPTARKD